MQLACQDWRFTTVFAFANDEENQELGEIIRAFKSYGIGEKNETYERYLFNKRQQEAGERFESFLASLRTLAKTCHFCQCMTDSLLRDRIVLGISDSQMRGRLVQERKLTLNGCIDICKSAETAETAESNLQAFTGSCSPQNQTAERQERHGCAIHTQAKQVG